MKQTLHFCPTNGFFGDTMPIKTEDGYHVFYNKLINGLTNKVGTLVWGHVYSPDLVHWEEMPDALKIGAPGTYDEKHCYSGSVIKKDDLYYIFYSGIQQDGTATVLKAVSRDLITWKQYDTEPLLLQPDEGYRKDGSWRDPCVFYHPGENCYWMFLTARSNTAGKDLYAGTIGLAKSVDLEHWTVYPPYWTPGISTVFECMDVFSYDAMWVMTYFWHETRCRMSDSPNGPWERPRVEAPDYFDHFAGRTCPGENQKRILFGWIPRSEADGAKRIWGGNMAIPREWYLLPDKTPATRCAASVLAHARRNPVKNFVEELSLETGVWDRVETGWIHRGTEGGMLLYEKTPPHFMFECRLRFKSRNSSASLMFRTNKVESKGAFACVTDSGYKIIFDSAEGLIRLREISEFDQKNDIAYIPYQLMAEEYIQVQLFVHKNMVELFVGNKKSLISRILLFDKGEFAVHAQDGCIEMRDMKMYHLE